MISEIIVKKAKNGDDEAFKALYESIYKDMYRVAYYLLQNNEDAEDAVSEAVFDIYKGIKKLKKCSSFKSWAMKILTIKCKQKIRDYCQFKTEDIETVECDSGEDLEKEAILKEDIKKALDVLSEEEKIIVINSAVAGLSSDEIADMLELKAATVRSKLSRALAKIRQRLEVGV